MPFISYKEAFFTPKPIGGRFRRPAPLSPLTAFVPLGTNEIGDATKYAIRGDPTQALSISGAAPSATGAIGTRTGIEEATTNLVVNPSLETDATSWSAVGAGVTIARSTTQASSGSASLSIVTPGSAVTEGAGIGLGTLTNGQAYSSRIRFHAANGATLFYRMFVAGDVFASGAITGTGDWASATISGTVTGATAAGTLQVYTDTTAQALTFYLDAVQAENKSYPTTYCDGSLGTGYAWTGTAHASTSTRAATNLAISAAAINTIVTATAGGVAFWLAPFLASTTLPNNRVFSWLVNGNDYIICDWVKATTKFAIGRIGGGAGGGYISHTSATTFSAGDAVFVVMGWDATGVYISVNGAASTFLAQTSVPDLSSTVFYFGAQGGTALHVNSACGPVLFASRPYTDAEIAWMYTTQWVPSGGLVNA